MRYDAEHKDETRKRVLKAAARAIREEGPFKVGVAAVMSRAGLTHGGFYAHFASREDMVAEGVGRMFEEARQSVDREIRPGRSPAEALAAYIDFYLSAEHRDTRTAGCPLPFLAADAPRLPDAARERYARGVAHLTERLADRLAALGRSDATDEARSMLAEMVGALSLARADPEPERSDAILATSRAALKARFNLEIPT
jgi:TetR/AcrR family transcriptional repressor of nem operon